MTMELVSAADQLELLDFSSLHTGDSLLPTTTSERESLFSCQVASPILVHRASTEGLFIVLEKSVKVCCS